MLCAGWPISKRAPRRDSRMLPPNNGCTAWTRSFS
jgi:hypothetical protein